MVEHPGGVGILAIDGEDRVVLVRQYRYAFERVLTEIPAGKRETGEEPFLTARRELKEEIGAEAGRWTELGRSSRRRGATERRCISIWRRT